MTKRAAAQSASAIDKLISDFRVARMRSVPLIGIETPDAAATLKLLTPSVKAEHPQIVWDMVRGVRALNTAGEAAIKVILQGMGAPVVQALTPVMGFLDGIRHATDSACIYMMNAQMFIDEKPVKQAIWNLRDTFKQDGRTLVLFGPSITIPTELDGDVIVFDEPLPTRSEVSALILKQFDGARLDAPTDELLGRAVDAVTGLKPFAIEQVTALALDRKEGIKIDVLQDRRCQIIEQTRGLSVWRGEESFDTIGGSSVVKTFIRQLIAGRDRFAGVVWLDEIEKQVGGASGDTTGIAQDQQMQMLTYMQDRRVPGLLLVGHPGTGKSEIAKATGREANVPTLQFDLGGMLGSLVGNSQGMIRAALKVVDAVTAQRPLFIATSNDLTKLSPELRSRFRLGTFFFDLPDREEIDVIWSIHMAKYGITETQADGLDALKAEPWTGREISTCCELAWRLNGSLGDAAQYIVPLTMSQPAKIKSLQEAANGTFLSASRPGVYRMSAAESYQPSQGRKFEV